MAPFELSVALKYLKPRWRQLSVSIISLISICVIALVVWLIVVFFSVTHGLEKNWTEKLIALTAPVRITPTEEYYSSFYYRIDSISSASDYTPKTIKEKLAAPATDPYDPAVDEEIPQDWQPPILDREGNLKDPVKIAFSEIGKIKDVSANDFEMSFSSLRLRLLREMDAAPGGPAQGGQSFITQSAYLGSMEPDNEMISRSMLPFSSKDLTNLLQMLSVASDNIRQDDPETVIRLDKGAAQKKFRDFFSFVKISELKTPLQGWPLPRDLLPPNGNFKAAALLAYDGSVSALAIPQDADRLQQMMELLQAYGHSSISADLEIKEGALLVNGKEPVGKPLLILEGGTPMKAALAADSLNSAGKADEILFHVDLTLQGKKLNGQVPFQGLEIGTAETQNCGALPCSPFWLYSKSEGSKQHFYLPSDADLGEGVLLPKNFRDSGVLLGDRGYLSYYSPTASSIQEMRVPVMVAGFFDPGILPIGGKFILASGDVAEQIRASQDHEELAFTNGINLRFSDLSRADGIKEQLQQAFKNEGIGHLWNIQTYKEYEFTKDILQQLRSEKNLFSLLSIIIMIVACSNIISMLIILVNDKKMEIGILRAMGAPSASIAAIFGICGVVMGLLGSALGIPLAALTLSNLQGLIDLLSRLQGFDMFNPVFYGETLPSALSYEALGFVILMTAAVSAISGIVPAIKACLLKPSEILRAE